jgi:cytochrome b561
MTGARRLHWWTAGLVAIMLALGWIMVAVPLAQLLLKFVLYQAHKTIGIVIFGLTLWRLCLRWSRGGPALPSGWRGRAAGLVHAGLLVLLLAMPVTGYLLSAASPSGVPTLFLGVFAIPHVIGPDPATFARLQMLHQLEAWMMLALGLAHGAAGLFLHRAPAPT